MPMAGPALCHNIYDHHQHSVLYNHNIIFEKGADRVRYCYCIGANLKIRRHFQWPILSCMAVAGCRWTTPCNAFLDADKCCVMLEVPRVCGMKL